MIFEKRTPQQIQEAVNNKDFTGGYNYWPWLWFVEKVKLAVFIVLPIFGICCLIFTEKSYNILVQNCVGFAAIIVGICIFALTKKQYKQQKNGISS